MKTKFKVLCVDDRQRPNEIPLSKWVKKGEVYTVVKVVNAMMQGGLISFQIEEIDLTGCEPYLFFSSTRFAPL